jgi:hypothetical protein
MVFPGALQVVPALVAGLLEVGHPRAWFGRKLRGPSARARLRSLRNTASRTRLRPFPTPRTRRLFAGRSAPPERVAGWLEGLEGRFAVLGRKL